MAALPELSGPPQTGRGVKGQYVYWVTMSHPRPETVEAHGVKVPTDFDRDSFRELLAKVHADCGVTIVEAASFQELHENGLPHQNCGVRSVNQYKWRDVAKKLRDEHKVCVDFATNIRTWSEAIIYGRVGSEHKGPELLDKDPRQWAANGNPMPFDDVIPRKWRAEGFQRKVQLTKQRQAKGQLGPETCTANVDMPEKTQ